MGDDERRPLPVSLAWSDEALDLFEQIASLQIPAFVVGGAVRDALLRLPLKDLDLATPDDGLKLARRIANTLGGAYYPLDSERSVGRAIIDLAQGKLVIDVARFRGDDLAADLNDRDFTINAMAVDLLDDPQRLIDPTGGVADARARLLRQCNRSAIAADPVRTLRAVRQSVQLGFRIEATTLADVRAQATRLESVSPERSRDEFFRLLALPKASTALKVADVLGLLDVVLPEAQHLHERDTWQRALIMIERLGEIYLTISPRRTDETAARFSLGMIVMGLDRYRQQLQAHLSERWADDRPHLALLTFAILLMHAVSPDAADKRAALMPLSNRERDRLSLILRYFADDPVPDDLSVLALHRYWRRLGAAGVDVVILELAAYLADTGIEIDQDDWIQRIGHARTRLEAYFDRYGEVVEPAVLVDGGALMKALALKPGPVVGKLLDAIREAQVVGTVSTVDDALALARSYVETPQTPTDGGRL
ncbi:MAG: CCA tRNA nucleotidyltransferase [Anaerolineae bacterium]|nr:CCA tRNA nucleotidyltransferase [Anaerolineae bacterium]